MMSIAEMTQSKWGVLPKDFKKQVARLEKKLDTETLSINEFRELLEFYKAAISYYTNRNDKLKEDFLNKYKSVFEKPHVIHLMKSNTSKGLKKKEGRKEVERDENKIRAEMDGLKEMLSEQIDTLKDCMDRQKNIFQNLLLERRGISANLDKVNQVRWNISSRHTRV
eukprot:TRINITY_DN12699_c0_g1_i17.p1 TRINITY_DN12699_c0_g1~~TRINITY_DN12699_c0_g1_i17.p1  ORF type:complete len:167 (-),score=45.99 TRINITY_DN12699_c0_g1_i17:746-1246(-)